MKKLIWISSYPKSGNTWVRYFLANYFYNKEKNDLGFNILNKIDKFPPQNLLKEFTKNGELDQSPYNVSKYWSLIQERMTKSNEDYIFTKNHNALVSIEGRNLTQEKYSLAFIYIVRDPRDIVISYSNFDKKLSIDKAIERMNSKNLFCHVSKKNPFDIEILGSWKFNYFSWKTGIPEIPRLIVRYEDLVLNTFNTKLKIINFLSSLMRMDVDKEQIKFSIAQSDFSRLQKLEEKKKFTESPKSFFNSGKIGQWKNILSKVQIKKIEDFCKLEMKEQNYL